MIHANGCLAKLRLWSPQGSRTVRNPHHTTASGTLYPSERGTPSPLAWMSPLVPFLSTETAEHSAHTQMRHDMRISTIPLVAAHTVFVVLLLIDFSVLAMVVDHWLKGGSQGIKAWIIHMHLSSGRSFDQTVSQAAIRESVAGFLGAVLVLIALTITSAYVVKSMRRYRHVSSHYDRQRTSQLHSVVGLGNARYEAPPTICTMRFSSSYR